MVRGLRFWNDPVDFLRTKWWSLLLECQEGNGTSTSQRGRIGMARGKYLLLFFLGVHYCWMTGPVPSLSSSSKEVRKRRQSSEINICMQQVDHTLSQLIDLWKGSLNVHPLQWRLLQLFELNSKITIQQFVLNRKQWIWKAL